MFKQFHDAMKPFAEFADAYMDNRNRMGLGGIDPEMPMLSSMGSDKSAMLQWKHFMALYMLSQQLMENNSGVDID